MTAHRNALGLAARIITKVADERDDMARGKFEVNTEIGSQGGPP